MIPDQVEQLVELLPERVAVFRNGKGNCIEMARLATLLLPKVGVACYPLACDVLAMNAHAYADIQSAGHLVRASSWSVAALCSSHDGKPNASEPHRRSGFGGHLVVAGDDWFLDLTVMQFSRPDRGIPIKAPIAGPRDNTTDGVQYRAESGAVIQYGWQPKVKKWRNTPAWRGAIDTELIDTLVQKIKGA